MHPFFKQNSANNNGKIKVIIKVIIYIMNYYLRVNSNFVFKPSWTAIVFVKFYQKKLQVILKGLLPDSSLRMIAIRLALAVKCQRVTQNMDI